MLMEFVENRRGFVEGILGLLLGPLEFFLIEKIDEGNDQDGIEDKRNENDK